MAAKVTKSKSAERTVEGFSPFIVLLAFLCGFLIWPFYGFMSYEVKYYDNGDILLSARKEIKISEQSEVPKASPQTSVQGVPAKQIPADSIPQDPVARDRWLVKKAVMEYNLRYPKMTELNLFELIGKGFLKELPNCPNNEVFVLSYLSDVPTIQCKSSKR